MRGSTGLTTTVSSVLRAFANIVRETLTTSPAVSRALPPRLLFGEAGQNIYVGLPLLFQVAAACRQLADSPREAAHIGSGA
jgi:hypothetical protein